MKELKLSVLLVEPGKCPKVIEIEDTLEAMQNIVAATSRYMSRLMMRLPLFVTKKVRLKGFR